MKPVIDDSTFGTITIDGNCYEHDVVIRLCGTVEKRRKKLSKAVYGTSHKVSFDEIRDVYEDGAEKIIIGTGQYDLLSLSPEAGKYLKTKSCAILLLPTPDALRFWNSENGSLIGLFHVTC